MKLRSLALFIASSTAMGLCAGLQADDKPATESGPSATAEAPVQTKAGSPGWLGVGTRRIPKLVAEHLGVPAGAGLSVEMVAPGSPAEKAGLKKDDVLVKLNDQVLVNKDQLATLIEGTEPGKKVKIQVMRSEAPMEIEAEITARPAEYARQAESTPSAEDNNPANEDLDKLFQGFGPGLADADALDKHMRQLRKHMEDMQQRLQAQAQAQAGGGIGGNGVQMQIFRMDNAQVQIMDDKGSISIHTKDGKSVLTAKDKAGNLMYEGPYETDQDKAKVPLEIRQRADRLKIQNMGRNLLEIKPGQPGQADPGDDANDPAEPRIDGQTKPGDKID